MATFDRQQSIGEARAVDISSTDDAMPVNKPSRTIYVGTGGNLVVELVGNPGVSVTYAVIGGSRHPLRVSKVLKTGTTASNLVVEF